MLVTVKGIYENGKITLSEKPPVEKKTEVMVTFIDETKHDRPTKRIAGILSGKIIMSEDFDDPLEDLKEYM